MRIGTLAIAFVLLTARTLPAEAGNVWSRFTEPSSEKPAAIGSYTAGCLAGAAELPLDGEGYQVMRLSRQRYYGHPLLVDFIRALSRQALESRHAGLLIGDLGQARGGPTPSGHRSHQTGLDVDIWFDLTPPGERLSRRERERRSASSMVSADGMAVNRARWNAGQSQILRLASDSDAVERIFVNAAIKKNLCATQRDRSWLRKIRPWWGHEEHFHVRLHCPPDSPECQPQEPVPAGDGCDAGLDWWFSAEARQPAKPSPRIEPILPPACETVANATPRLRTSPAAAAPYLSEPSYADSARMSSSDKPAVIAPIGPP
jgi:penicillin-insensitive murein endopeptidase